MSLDLAIINVNCYTMDDQVPRVEAVGIKGNRIALVGSRQRVKSRCSRKTSVLDGGNHTLLPGFNDSHTHFARMGISISEHLDLGNEDSKRSLLETVKEEIQYLEANEWLVGVNWDESKWEGSTKAISKEELDKLAPNNPVALERVDGHLYCVNQVALNRLNLDRQMEGYETQDGEPTGRILEEARFAVRKAIEPTGEQIKRGIETAIEKAHKLGVTSVHDMHVNKKEFGTYQSLKSQGDLSLRVHLFFEKEYLKSFAQLGIKRGFGDTKLKVGGIKLFTDGSIGAKTAWVTEGYKDNPENRGMPILGESKLEKLAEEIHNNDLQTAVHAIGDKAISLSVNPFAAQATNKTATRDRLEHVEMIKEEQIHEMKELNLIASIQPNFIYEWGLPGGMYEERFPKERVSKINPLRWLFDEEIKVCFGSDCMPFDPLYGIHSAVNAPHTAQKISPREAISAYTVGSAYAESQEGQKGTITPGKLADLVMLNDDPLKYPAKIKSMDPVLTIFDGEVVYQK